MKPEDPTRLQLSPDTPPALRDALRVIESDVPDLASLEALADRTMRALHQTGELTTAADQASKLLLPKLALVVTGAAALVFAALHYGARTPARQERRAAPEPPRSAQEEPSAAPGEGPNSAAGPSHGPDAPARERSAPAPADRAADQPARGSKSWNRVPPAVRGGQRAANAPATRSGASSTPSSPRPSAEATPEAHAPSREPEQSELELIERAQHALLGDPRRARELLEQHRHEFPNSGFAQERDVLMLDVFEREHDKASLREGARMFLQRYPHSAHRARVEKLLESAR